MQAFKAFRIYNDDKGYRSGVEEITRSNLSPGDVVIESRFSSVNYKDALAGTGKGQVVRRFPVTGGIDCAGEVVESEDPQFRPGDPVLATGYGLGVSHDGGYSRYVRMPSEWLVPLPESMGPFSAMVLGTAGFTAALAMQRMEQNGQAPDKGPILVTGASGGVGCIAVMLLAANGYRVTALSGKHDRHEWLRSLGAEEVIDRNTVNLSEKLLDWGRWGGIVDTVGGKVLSGLLPQVAPHGNVAAIGLAAGHELTTSMMPFILRGISLLGIDSVDCDHDTRLAIWNRLAGHFNHSRLDQIINRVVPLSGLNEVFEQMLSGTIHGRVVVETQ